VERIIPRDSWVLEICYTMREQDKKIATEKIMRIVRFQAQDEAPKYGWLLEDKVGGIEGDPFGKYRRRDAKIALADVKLLAPCVPSKIVCVGRNYVEHAKELGSDVPKIPLIFLKPPSSIISPGDTIILPPQSKQVEHEAELVVVVGKRGRNVTAEDAKKHIFGYTVGNDVTARDLQKLDGQWTRAKGFDTFCAFGPWIDTDFNIADALITCKVNGQPRQMASTRDMVFSVPTLVAYISSVMTLEPGDLIFTGTPAGVGALEDGSEVVVEIEGLGVLRNPVKAESR
jgi:2-keto-4-pentenoate hydratase/2-oxohepta-3-ene-1,7-dioic acid hydratase in catechol pathway